MYKILVGLIRFLIGWKLNVKVSGVNNLPEKGPVLVIFNHCDFLDTTAIIFSLPRKLTAFVAHDYRYNPLVILFRMVGSVIYVKRGQNDTKALDRGLKVLNKGGFLVLAPEGTRGSTNMLGEGKYGAAYLAGRSDCLVVPVGIQGTHGGFKKLVNELFSIKKIPIWVRIGKPFHLEVSEFLLDSSAGGIIIKDEWQAITNNQMMPEIACLLPKGMRGIF